MKSFQDLLLRGAPSITNFCELLSQRQPSDFSELLSVTFLCFRSRTLITFRFWHCIDATTINDSSEMDAQLRSCFLILCPIFAWRLWQELQGDLLLVEGNPALQFRKFFLTNRAVYSRVDIITRKYYEFYWRIATSIYGSSTTVDKFFHCFTFHVFALMWGIFRKPSRPSNSPAFCTVNVYWMIIPYSKLIKSRHYLTFKAN